MRIKWCGTATLLIESGDSRLLIDPYLRKFQKNAVSRTEEVKDADAILITHPHFDHFCDIGVYTALGIRKVYVAQCGIDHARAQGFDVDCMQPIAANEKLTVGRFTIVTYQSKHCVFDAATVLRVFFSPRTWLRAKDAVAELNLIKRFKIGNEIYAFEISDGEKRVMVLGSAGMDGDTEYPQDADLLVFPFQGRSRMDRYMQPFLDEFRPKGVMIDHFDDAFPPFTHTMNVKKFESAVKKRLPSARTLIPEEGEWYEV